MIMATQSIVIALGLVVLFVAVGEILGRRAPQLRRVPLPGAVIGGILIPLIRSADPEQRTSLLSSYADKQPFYEPLMGGGLVTALALVTVATVGPIGTLLITATVLSGWLAYAARLVRKASDDEAAPLDA